MASKVKPGTKHPSKPGLVMGTNGRYVAKSTYAKQVKAGNQPSAKTTPKVTPAKTTPTQPATSSKPQVGAIERRHGRIVKWNGKRWTAAGTGPRQPTPTPRKADATPKQFTSTSKFSAPNIPKTTPTPKPVNTSTPVQRLTNAAKNVKFPKVKLPKNARGGPGQVVAGIVGDQVIKASTPHIIRGAMKVAGKDTTNIDKAARGEPVVKSVNGVDFNVNTEAGRRGYQKAIAKRNQQAQGSRSGRGAGRAGFEVKPSNSTSSSQSGVPKAEQDRLRVAADRRRKAGEMSDIRGSVGAGFKKGEGTGSTKTSRNQDPNINSRKTTTTPSTKPSGNGNAKKKPKTGANDPRNASYISSAKKLNASKTTTKKDRDALRDKGLSTWAKANRKMIERSGTKKQKEILNKIDNPQSAARRAGYPGNMNY